MQICKKERCTGCLACYNICPKQCIEICCDELGFMFPEINRQQCVDCGICIRVCPVNAPTTKNKIQAAFACWSLDLRDRQTSASGGAASVFSYQIVKNGGVVYGAAMGFGGKVCHVRIDNIDDLYRLKDSKYVQSNVNQTYKLAKIDLENGYKVLYIGTPCQIAGLKNYLCKEYESLITVELICHGVPSQKLLDDHIVSCIGDSNIDKVTFRMGGKMCLRIFRNNEEVYHKSALSDIYFIGFLKGLYYRESCYKCNYAVAERISDIVIGDFWGLGINKPFKHDIKDGVSLLLPCSLRGLDFIDKNKDYLFLEKREISEAVRGNPQLSYPAPKNKNMEKFKTLYVKIGFTKAAKSCLKIQRVKYIILSVVNKIMGQ